MLQAYRRSYGQMALSGKNSKKSSGNSLFQRISLFFFQRPRHTAILWLLITVFGIASYTTLLKREGFPSVETPLATAQGAYIVNDAAQVDREVSKPLSEF